MHNRDEKEWNEIGHPSDYGFFAYAGGKENLPHPDVPAPFRNEFGAIDGSFGPFAKTSARRKTQPGARVVGANNAKCATSPTMTVIPQGTNSTPNGP